MILLNELNSKSLPVEVLGGAGVLAINALNKSLQTTQCHLMLALQKRTTDHESITDLRWRQTLDARCRLMRCTSFAECGFLSSASVIICVVNICMLFPLLRHYEANDGDENDTRLAMHSRISK